MSSTSHFLTKLEWLKNNFPNHLKIDPYKDLRQVDEIKQKMFDDGLTKRRPAQNSDSAIINLLLVAQGKKKLGQRNMRVY